MNNCSSRKINLILGLTVINTIVAVGVPCVRFSIQFARAVAFKLGEGAWLQEKGYYMYEPIMFETRTSAETVLASMIERLSMYSFVTVEQMYELADIKDMKFTYQHYGWKDLKSAVVKRRQDGKYYIELPRPTKIINE